MNPLLRVMIRNMKSYSKILFLFWVVLMGGLPVSAMAMTPPLQDGVNSRNQNLGALFQHSGLKNDLDSLESVLKVSANINAKVLMPGQVEFAKRIMRQTYSSEIFYELLRKPFVENYKPQHIQSVVAWYRSPLGKKILNSEKESNNSEDLMEEMVLFEKNLSRVPLGKKRLSSIKAIERSLRRTEAGKSLYLGYVKLMHPFNKNIKGESLAKLLRKLDKSITKPMRKINLRVLFYSYKKLKDEELEQYAGFLNSPAGHWYNQLALKGFKDGVRRISNDAEVTQGELIKELASGGPQFPLTKAIAPPGYRYLLISKRDPFRPLIKKDRKPISFDEAQVVVRKVPGVSKKEKVLLRAKKRKSKPRFFGGELSSVAPMALLVWEKIKAQHPELYRKLHDFESLFNDRKRMEGLADDKYAEALEGYRDALEQSSGVEMEESPLQVAYKSLKMTGIIRKKTESVAMFEVGSTGYVVRKGDLVGPAFGYVGEIQDEKIIVLEKFRNYYGNILTKRQIIEFFQSPS
ncbi:MAG: DUF2059 domain-containing protein [Nitrospinaceae bacterium]|nr:DUF2059 domain-containing protein [Nitrospinaceae bacterium]